MFDQGRVFFVLLLGMPFAACMGGEGTQLPTRHVAVDCVWVDINEIYADPRPYDGQVVCTEGIIQESFPSVFIADRLLILDEYLFQHLEIGWRDYDPTQFEHGDRVRARGLLTFFRECYDYHVVHGGFMEDYERFCGPPDVPMFLEIETLQRVGP